MVEVDKRLLLKGGNTKFLPVFLINVMLQLLQKLLAAKFGSCPEITVMDNTAKVDEFVIHLKGGQKRKIRLNIEIVKG